uniref:L domain-like protein n=2 Tax=Cyclophora tenuis TaxID=216820 RepID=A0A7S1GN11_CYCTE
MQLHETSLRERIPSEIGQLSLLNRDLTIADCLLTGTLPSEIGQLRQLQRLIFTNNRLTGTIPTEIGRMTQLTIFESAYNLLTGSIPTEIGNCVNLQALGVFRNTEINGSITELIDHMPRGLFRFFLGELSLTGSIPSSIGEFGQLDSIRFQENHLTGSLPSEIGLLRSLTALDVFGNQMTGSIPSTIGLLNSVRSLSMGFNTFNGRLPMQMSLLNQLGELEISANDLTGSPGVLASLASLTSLYIHDNRFDGIGGLCTGKTWVNLAVNDCSSTPVLSCSCCTVCCRTAGTGSCESIST